MQSQVRHILRAPMSSAPPGPAPSRRDFLAATTLGAVATFAGAPFVAGCGKKAKSGGAASNAKQTAEVLPVRRPLKLLNPDLPGAGPIPDGYLKYPTTLVRAVKNKPGAQQAAHHGHDGGVGTDAARTRAQRLSRRGQRRARRADPPERAGRQHVRAEAQRHSRRARRAGAPVRAALGDRQDPALRAGREGPFRGPHADHLKGTRSSAYPMLATLPTASRGSTPCGAGVSRRCRSPSNGPFPWAMFYRKDLTDKLGVAAAEDDRRAVSNSARKRRSPTRASGRSARAFK